MLKFFQQPTLFCFSPAVMIFTIAIEVALAIWVVARYATSTSQRLIVSLLICLAAFQLAEFNVCSSEPIQLFWSRFGYVFITALPPLGLHLVTNLRRENRSKLLATAYGTGAGFAAAFIFLPTDLAHGVCSGNYVIFLLAEPLASLYGIYYAVFVLVAMGLAFVPLAKKVTASRHNGRKWLGVAYLAFTVPCLIINIILPSTRIAVPSIMCGFAVLFALIIGLKVAPLVLKKLT